MDHNIVYKEQVLPNAHDLLDPVTTVLICQHTLIRRGIGQILAGTRFSLVEGADDGLESAFREDGPKPGLFLICESRSPDEHAEIIQKLKAQFPSARVVILADQMEPQAIRRVCGAGLDGLCSTTMPREVLIKALELVMLGESFVSAALSLSVFQGQGSLQAGSRLPVEPMPAMDFAAARSLSVRETQILRCLMQGASNKIIARNLGVADATVKVHVKAILRKIKAANRTQAAIWAQQNLSPEGESHLP